MEISLLLFKAYAAHPLLFILLGIIVVVFVFYIIFYKLNGVSGLGVCLAFLSLFKKEVLSFSNIDNGFLLVLSSILFIGGLIIDSLDKIIDSLDKKNKSDVNIAQDEKIETEKPLINSSRPILSSVNKKRLIGYVLLVCC